MKYMSRFASSFLVLISPSAARSIVPQTFDLPFALQRRNVQCDATQNLTSCPTDIPFCCPTTTTCLPVTSNNDTVICCPQGANCVFIQPLNCDITQQNATMYPNNAIHTDNLNAILQPCQGGCCPTGYSCQGGTGLCAMDKATSTSSTQTSSASMSATTSSSSSAPIIIPTSTQPPSHAAANSNHSLAIGLSLGILFGVAILAAIVLLCLRRKKRQNKSYVDKKSRRNSPSPNFMGSTPQPPQPTPSDPYFVGPFQTTTKQHKPGSTSVSSISEPVLMSQYGNPAHRTDFLGRRHEETLFENKAKPAWSSVAGSTTTKRERSLTSATPSTTRTATSKSTTPDTTPRRKSRVPLFNGTPLRFGLPVTPKPRPERSAESLGSTSTVKPTNRMRDDSPAAHQSLLERSHSQSSVTTVETDVSEPETKSVRAESGETINVLMKPPEFERANRERRDTTFSSVMREAGWEGEGWRSGGNAKS